MSLRDLLMGGTNRPGRNSFHPYTRELIQLLENQRVLAPGYTGADICTEEGRLASLFQHYGYQLAAAHSRPDTRSSLETLRRPRANDLASSGQTVSTGLPANAFDFVISERALYYADLGTLRAECSRILRPTGHVILVTDKRVYGGGAQSEAFEDILRTYCRKFREKVAPFDIQAAVAGFFGGKNAYEDAIVGHQDLDRKEFMQQTRSLPIYPVQGDPQRERMEAALDTFFSRWAGHGTLRVPFVCRIAAGRLSTPASAPAPTRQAVLTAV